MNRGGYAVEQRLRLIDFLLLQYGHVNRSALERYYGISVVQASMDLKRYMSIAPDNMAYDSSAKVYRATPKFELVYL